MLIQSNIERPVSAVSNAPARCWLIAEKHPSVTFY